MAFFLFLLVNAALFIRPQEIEPDLDPYKIYNLLILSCLFFALPAFLHQVTRPDLLSRPVTVAMFGLTVCIGLSRVLQSDVEGGVECFVEFLKVLVYYFLMLSVVNTPRKLRWFIAWLGGCIVVLAIVALLRYYGVIELRPLPGAPTTYTKKDISDGKPPPPHFPYVVDHVWDAEGNRISYHRLRGTGTFNDPNDLCLPLSFGILLCVYGLMHPRFGLSKILLLIPIGILLTALFLTYSRGGLIGLAVGLLVLFGCRYGARNAFVLFTLVFIPALPFVGKRLAESSVTSGTGQSRVQLWSMGLTMFRANPVSGVGTDKYHEQANQVAHNSYLHTYAEQGFLGGTLFLALFYLSFRYLRQMREKAILERESQRILDFLLAMLAAFMTGMLTLSVQYLVMTYSIVGLVAVYLNVTPALPAFEAHWDSKLVRRVLYVSVGFLGFMYVFVRVFSRFS